jgi:hypothetical protein
MRDDCGGARRKEKIRARIGLRTLMRLKEQMRVLKQETELARVKRKLKDRMEVS